MRYVWLLFEQLPHHARLPECPAFDHVIAVNRRWFLAHTFKAVAHAMLGEDAAALRAWNEAKALNIVGIAAVWLGASSLSAEEQAEQTKYWAGGLRMNADPDFVLLFEVTRILLALSSSTGSSFANTIGSRR